MATPPNGLAKAASGLETFLLRRLLESSKVLSGPKGSLQEALFTDTLADAIASQGGLGVAKLLQGQFEEASGQAGQASNEVPGTPLPELPAGFPDLLAGIQDRISSPYGIRKDPFTGALKTHDGIDLPAPLGTDILAPAAGTVSFVGERGGYGQVVEIQQEDGRLARFAHTSAQLVSPGQRVQPGEAIAQVGSTGRSTGPHLHLELLQQNRSLDPIKALKSYAARVDNISAGEVP